jgi:peptidoglycan/xylan/chitin deacetylase (PgdA/CDA1 family)
VSSSAFVAYAGLVTLGVLRPSLEMFADVVWRGPEGAKGVALTFDDGPHPRYTRSVLDVLDGAGAKAAFFAIGEKGSRHPEILREIVERGHLLGVHGNRHDRALAFRSLAQVRADLARAIEALTAATGQRPRLFRPAVGQTNPRIARAAEELGLTLVGWSVRARDGIKSNPESVIARGATCAMGHRCSTMPSATTETLPPVAPRTERWRTTGGAGWTSGCKRRSSCDPSMREHQYPLDVVPELRSPVSGMG